MNWDRMRALIVKEFIQVMRDKITLAIILFMPLAQLLIFGFAINTDIKHLKTVVFDQSRTQESREMINSLTASNYFDVIKFAASVREVNENVESGRAKVGIVFPPDYARDIQGGRQTSVQVIVDATDNLSASSALSAAQTIGMLKSQEILAEKFSRLGIRVPGQAIDMRIRLWYNPDFVTSWYIVPGIMGLLLTLTLISMMSMAIVRESEQGTLEEVITNATATIGEKITLRRFAIVEKGDDEFFGAYMHMGGKISVLAKLSGKEDAAVAKNIAMQIASMSPAYITRDEIPADVVEHERGVQMNIMKEDPKMAGKSEDMLTKIIEGKISKHFKDLCLMDQEFFLNPDQKVSAFLKQNGASVDSFIRYAVGEGIEKKEENFVEEVMSQIKG